MATINSPPNEYDRTTKCTRVAVRAFPEIKVTWRQPGDFDRSSIGIVAVLPEFPIEHESVEAFRSYLRATEDPINKRIGELGEIIFLNTKVFHEDYLKFCDDFAANRLTYPRLARDEMRQRRDALLPCLGMPILHGGISYDGLFLNVFVLKSTGQILCCEQDSR